MTQPRTIARSSVSAHRAGDLLGALVNGFLLWLIHVWPGWDVLPFLTADTPRVLGLVNAALVVGILVNLAPLVRDPGWLTPAGLVLTSAFGVAVSVRVLQVFPFGFDSAFDWALVVRILLIVGIVGAAIGALVALVSLLRLLGGQEG